MFSFGMFLSFPVVLLIFLVSLVIVIAAAAQFTRKLEALCAMFDLSTGILSLLSALGANIPNYVASSVALLDGHDDVGVGIIIGSNIYNIAIILGLCILATSERTGIVLSTQEKRDVGVIAGYAFALTLLAFAVIALLFNTSHGVTFAGSKFTPFFLPTANVLTLATFGALLVHLLRRSHERREVVPASHTSGLQKTPLTIFRLGLEVIFTLVIALGGVMVMVQSGQTLTYDLHLPSVLAGLLVLAVATSLPNTVVAVSLARTGEAAACVEEICSSNSINTVLGIILPLLFWPGVLADRFLLLLDGPYVLILTLGLLFGILSGRMSRRFGILLLCLYVVWVAIRFWV